MKLQPDRLEGTNMISGYDRESISVNGQPRASSVLVPAQGDVRDWECRKLEDLRAEHFERVAELAPEVVIFGSGARLRFPPPSLLRPLIERGIGVETMDTPAACRTYNILVSEGRSVVAALLVEGEGQG
ncbi:MAG TPA: Mth938-like domain-containing protein [Burkholderiaceae bacterium]|nr:Mth938-like domain-containing protein [Burkholderiaceae bacterium]